MNTADEKFQKLFHNNLVGMLLTDEHHRVTDINDHLLQLAGLKREEAIGKTGLELGLIQEEFMRGLWQQMAETGRLSNAELPFVTRGNKKITFLFSSEGIEINGRKCWLSTVIDISIKKIAEERIAGSELRFRTLAKTAPVGIFETDAKGNTIYVNEAWMQYTGLSYEQAINNEFMGIIHPEDREQQVNSWTENAQKGRASLSEYRIINKAGQVKWVNGRAIPLVNEKGEISGYIGTITDVTEIKLALELLKQSHHSLNERTEQLRELSTYLQKIREEERTKIAREIHDELGQQLTGLKMDISWLRRKIGQVDPEVNKKFEDAIVLIDSAVKSIRLIVSELRPSVIDDLGLSAAFEWLIEDFSTRTGIDVDYQTGFDDSDINPDSSIGLFRILQESLTNIARHASAKKVYVKIAKTKEMIRLSIEDNGVGFDASVKQSDPGFGLLGIKERIHMMKGDFRIDSKQGQGTRVNVSIPVG